MTRERSGPRRPSPNLLAVETLVKRGGYHVRNISEIGDEPLSEKLKLTYRIALYIEAQFQQSSHLADSFAGLRKFVECYYALHATAEAVPNEQFENTLAKVLDHVGIPRMPKTSAETFEKLTKVTLRLCSDDYSDEILAELEDFPEVPESAADWYDPEL